MRRRNGGFTLVELLVSIAVLVVLILFVSRLFSSATMIITSANKRMDADAQLRPLFDRMAKGLVWNGVSASDTPIVFLPLTISGAWPAATNGNSDSDYELIGPSVFRFEYFYLLKSGVLSRIYQRFFYLPK